LSAPVVISKNSQLTIGLVISLVSLVGTGGYFIGNAHSRIDRLELDFALHKNEGKEGYRTLHNIDRRLSRIEGRLLNLNKQINIQSKEN